MEPASQSKEFWRTVDASSLTDVYSTLTEFYVFAKDRDGRFTACNPPLTRAMGFHFEAEVIGKTDYDFFEVRLADAYRTEDLGVMENGKAVRDEIWHVPDTNGKIGWFISSKFPLRNCSGAIVGILGVMRDSTKTGGILSPLADLEPVLNYVAAHYAESIRIGDLAKKAHLSLSQFERRFRRALGMTPARYLIRVRLDAASHRLATTDESVTNVAIDCGFYDHSHFSRLFRRTFGQSPSDYRKRYRRR